MTRGREWGELPKSAKLGFQRIVRNDVSAGPRRPNITQAMIQQTQCECNNDNPCTSKTCQNAYERVECIQGHCRCEKCSNQRFQKKMYAKTVVRAAGDKGRGIFAAEAVP